MAEDKKIIFSMSGVSKTYQGAPKPVIKNISLSFFESAYAVNQLVNPIK